MRVNQPTSPIAAVNQNAQSKLPTDEQKSSDDSKLREAFDSFVGQTFFSQMISSMRKTVGKSAYFHGGRAEEIFQSQLDQVLSERMAEVSADQFTGPMFELFTMQRR